MPENLKKKYKLSMNKVSDIDKFTIKFYRRKSNFNPELIEIGQVTLKVTEVILNQNLKFKVNSEIKFSLKSKFRVHDRKC